MAKQGHFVAGLLAGSVAGATIGLMMMPRRKRNSLMRSGKRFWVHQIAGRVWR